MDSNESTSACQPNLSYTITNNAITSLKVRAIGNRCSVPIAVTLPVGATASGGTTTFEQLRTDPVTAWTKLSGSQVTFSLNTPIAV